MEAALLSDLCSSCHLSPPKYKCPRCSTRTCSLQCSKRHKQRAGCSGKRDQTAYMPKAKIYTAEGIDHDYNFISSIEKQIENGTRIQPPLTHYHEHRGTGYWQLMKKLGINVIDAPRGMSRENLCKSHRVNG
jgi:hypothetical protein